jgi:methanogenic corrinoid protein MtbC1
MTQQPGTETPHFSNISATTVKAYYEQRFQLIDHVNRKLTERNQTERLVPENALELMYTNHQNHLSFIHVVLRYGLFDLLWPTMVWAYRAYHNQGFSLEYFPSELQTWQEAFQTFLKEEQAKELDQVYNWMRAQHVDLVTQIKQQQDQEPAQLPALSDSAEQFLEAALEGDFRHCQQMLNQFQVAGQTQANIFNTIIAPVMHKIGLMWEHGCINAVKEHLASSIVTRLLATMQVSTTVPQERRGHAIVTAGQNEHHQIGAWMIADSLENDGWRVQYLGANSPERDLLELIQEMHPHVVAISVNMIGNLPAAERIIRHIKDRNNNGVRVMVGGQAFAARSDLWQLIGADGSAGNIDGALELARSWWGDLQRRN